ncbi:hypothetical protein HLRTI_000369 [Halorhabdus tiamatea SARL4B]|uniref:Uncharacterized protein n=1 Tax=Halorhabdus tiamatea SARL4B TaxID=1033806 RepID=F7PK82_9EURY|nr:DUF5810 domain-containing protein [Halorhabdus tiamatea]ERJ07616.1 hypothetical protein HLRTI_000369 [Halorhabdus tiamatea SARL4B]CCQ33433.1 conserved hypothetical protein [Halorhabdus tiamatea SARL4B]
MGYACPVCEAPQVDARHLANHLAFTALLGDDDHEAWLEEHAPGWDQEDDEGLAALVVEHATAVDLSESVGHEHTSQRNGDGEFAGDVDRPGDLAGGGPDTIDDHDPGVTFDDFGDGPTARSDPTLDADAKNALREAYEMTRVRRERAQEESADADAGETE